ncbi:MAG: hypothetical protein AB8B65_12140 [Kordia sp.]|uniref:hypothetical protein n=1 Tax=Kordia sp. TaxID=1965332 RepID=UPI00385BD28A
MKIKKRIFSFVCVLVLFATACTSDDITSDETSTRASAQQIYPAQTPTNETNADDEVVVVVDTMGIKRIRYTSNSSTRPNRRK